ncbi:MAG: PE-PPE domain-containing protein [Mycobacterium sp.]|uniref:PE family protein n=1 Tax=Mycobacterium sp. TaxID=1785 RepID=UPI001ECAF946|nr:PE-PPE domain-containing protein [Mycobacterium sp.]MBW0019048.1 PE-PPE domain-containing protein [Mycobacterium sp.]
MSYVNVEPDFVSAAAADVSQIRSAISQANAAAATPTGGVVAAAADEVSAAVASVFNGYGQQFQTLIAQAGAFQDQFATLLTSAGSAYAQAEAAALNQLGTATTPVQDLLAPLVGSAGNPGVTTGVTASDPLVKNILIMTGSGTANPPSTYINNVYSRYLTQFTGFSSLIPVTTAEGLYPFTGTKDLTLDISLARGVTALDNAINLQISPSNVVIPGVNNIAVLGYSQSAIIASMEMPKLVAEGFSPGQINFTLLGDPSNPNGGLLARFPGLSLPSLGITFGTTTPSNDYPTTIYTLEYDGFADFPQYPIDVFSDLNALAGIVFVHGTYPHLTQATLNTAITLSQSGAPSMTTYYMIPTENLPLLTPLRAIPLLGTPLADLIQPDLKAIINWGYGDPNYGWSTGPADVPTAFGFLPPLSDTMALGPLLASGTGQGFSAFGNDLSHLSLPSSASVAQAVAGASATVNTLAANMPTSAESAISDALSGIQSANNNLIGTLTTDFSTAYAVALPTADIATAVAVSLPSYDVDLFVDGIQQAVNGDPAGLVNAFGRPIAADVGLATLAGGFELIALENAAETILTGTPNPGPQ